MEPALSRGMRIMAGAGVNPDRFRPTDQRAKARKLHSMFIDQPGKRDAMSRTATLGPRCRMADDARRAFSGAIARLNRTAGYFGRERSQ